MTIKELLENAEDIRAAVEGDLLWLEFQSKLQLGEDVHKDRSLEWRVKQYQAIADFMNNDIFDRTLHRAIERTEQLALIEWVLHNIPKKYANILQGLLIEKKSWSEVAAAEAISLGTLSAYRKKALECLEQEVVGHNLQEMFPFLGS